jgi:hypothetical protein
MGFAAYATTMACLTDAKKELFTNIYTGYLAYKGILMCLLDPPPEEADVEKIVEDHCVADGKVLAQVALTMVEYQTALNRTSV